MSWSARCNLSHRCPQLYRRIWSLVHAFAASTRPFFKTSGCVGSASRRGRGLVWRIFFADRARSREIALYRCIGLYRGPQAHKTQCLSRGCNGRVTVMQRSCNGHAMVDVGGVKMKISGTDFASRLSCLGGESFSAAAFVCWTSHIGGHIAHAFPITARRRRRKFW